MFYIRVTYLCAGHPPFDKRIHYKICPLLVEAGYDVITVNPNAEDSIDRGIRIKGYAMGRGYIGRITSLIRLYRVGKSLDANILVAPEPDSLLISYFIMLLDKRVRVVFDCHEWYSMHFTNVVELRCSLVGRILNCLVSGMLAYLCRRVDAIITVNDSMTEFYKRFNPNSHTIPSLAERALTSVSRGERKDFIYFGSFCSSYQVSVLLDAARELKNAASLARIVVIGGYEEPEAQQQLSMAIKTDHLSEHIELKGWLPKLEAFQAMAQGLAGIMRFDTGFYKGLPALPNKTFEYMALGLPIICCRHSRELSRLLVEYNCGVAVHEETGKDLAEAILYLQDNKEQCLILGANAVEAVRNKYNWNNYGTKLLALFQTLELRSCSVRHSNRGGEM